MLILLLPIRVILEGDDGLQWDCAAVMKQNEARGVQVEPVVRVVTKPVNFLWESWGKCKTT